MWKWLRTMTAPPKTYLDVQLRATRALVKFCEDHDYGASTSLDTLRACLAALEAEDMATAVAKFQEFYCGPYGFDDWFPPAVFAHEDGDYAWAVFEGLAERWHRLMSLSAPGKKGK